MDSQLTVNACISPSPEHARRWGWRGFTLVELLVVMAIVGIMATLLVPAVRSLVGVGGRRGGMNTVTSTIEKARLAAVENGVNTYVGFPFGAADPESAFSSLIVLRDAREDETNGAIVPLSRWIRMPAGIYIEAENLADIPAEADLIPQLRGSEGFVDVSSLVGLTFDRFGRLKPEDAAPEIRVGEKASPEGEFLQKPENHFKLTVQPLTGRVVTRDMLMPSK